MDRLLLAHSFLGLLMTNDSEPIGGEISVACESGILKNTPKTAMEKALAEQLETSNLSTSLDNSQTRRCYYTSIPRLIKQKGIHAQQLTSLNIDKVRDLRHVFQP